ncbi:FAD-dependent oxidoreductase [Mycolicibacterium nivoides]|uniref:FAD-dependent oxidoreductase n=1 Tax=Mycolicibacterium nivoides TaxID=2487344 RepID=UPI0024051CCA|nr:FAD-dependent oxidoreductase [Mycolicibacterium nivoides]
MACAKATDVGDIHWTGTETTSDHPGYIEGAIESGLRVAQEVAQALSPIRDQRRLLLVGGRTLASCPQFLSPEPPAVSARLSSSIWPPPGGTSSRESDRTPTVPR